MGIGDELMAAGQARKLKENTGRQVAIVDQYGRLRKHPVWDHNPDLAKTLEKDTLRVLNCSGIRPYIRSKSPTRWVWKPFSPTPARMVLTEKEEQFGKSHAGYILLEPNVKQQSTGHRNKEWPWGRWQELANRHPGRCIQVGPAGTPKLDGVTLVVTETFRLACAVLKHSVAAVVPEGGLHHAAAAVGCPAVVLFGGFISPDITGYPFQRNLFTGGKACGMRIDCKHCRFSMDAITVDMVDQHLKEITDEVR